MGKMPKKRTNAQIASNARRILQRRNKSIEKRLESQTAENQKIMRETIERNNRAIEALKAKKNRLTEKQVDVARKIEQANADLRLTQTNAEANSTILARSYLNNDRGKASAVYSYLSTLKDNKRATEQDAINEAFKILRQQDPNAKKPDLLTAYKTIYKKVTDEELTDDTPDKVSNRGGSPLGIIKAQEQTAYKFRGMTVEQLKKKKRYKR